MWTFLYGFLKDSICVVKIIINLEMKSFGKILGKKLVMNI
jgi:hypothetical protein